jgi:hypothetical protein
MNGKQYRFTPFLPKLLNVGSFAKGHPLPHMQNLYTLRADLSRLLGSLQQIEDPTRTYYQVDSDLVIKFGGIQLQAMIQRRKGVCIRITINMKYHSSINTEKGL